MINISLTARMVMETDIHRLSLDDTLVHAKQIVYFSKFRSACVAEKGGTLRGIVTRTTLIEDVHRPVVLLDHNEFAQAVEGIDTSEIIEIIDHHWDGAISTLKPVKFLNDPVGSTSAIITKKYSDIGALPTTTLASILLAGILSDTMILKMSIITPEDHKKVTYLTSITGIA